MDLVYDELGIFMLRLYSKLIYLHNVNDKGVYIPKKAEKSGISFA